MAAMAAREPVDMKITRNKLFAVAFCAIWLSVSLGHALTLAQLKTEMRRNLRDTSSDTSDQRYSDALLTDFANEAQRDIVNTTWLSYKTTSYVLTANTTYYSLPDDIIVPVQAIFKNSGGSTIELNEVSLKSLYDNNVGWEKITGNPNQYVVTQATSSTANSTSSLKISYFPIPNNTSTGTVTLWYYNQVDDLVSDSDVPFNGKRNLYPYHMAIVYHTAMRLKIIEGRLDEAQLFSSLYLNSLKTISEKLGSMPNYNPSVGVLNRK